jgi:hypothetical protein
MKKRLLIFVAIGIPLFIIVIFVGGSLTNKSKAKQKSFFDNFQVKLSGKVIDKKDGQHGFAKIVIQIAKTNMNKYADTTNITHPYCVIDSGIATLFGSFSKINVNDSVTIGPNDSVFVYNKSY